MQAVGMRHVFINLDVCCQTCTVRGWKFDRNPAAARDVSVTHLSLLRPPSQRILYLMISSHASISAADKEIAFLEGEIARTQLQLFSSRKRGSLGSVLVPPTLFRIKTLLPTLLRQNAAVLFVEEKKHRLIARIAHMQGQLMAAKKRRNCFTLLCRIPDELLAQILAQTQLSPMHQHKRAYSTSLYSFAFNEGWGSVRLVCSHVSEIAMSSPELWAYVSIDWPKTRISAHLARSGNVSLVLNYATTTYYNHEQEIEPDKIVTLGGAHFARSHALSVTLNSMKNLEVQQVMHGNQPNPHLAILHMDLGNNTDSVEMLGWYPALVELSLTRVVIKLNTPANVGTRPAPIFPLLTRLHLHYTNGCESLWPLLELLKNAPCLAELVINQYSTYCTRPSNPGVYYERKVELPSLLILVIISIPEIVHSLLMALSWHFPLLQNLVVEVAAHGGPESSKVDLCPDVLTLWKRVTSSVQAANETIPLAGAYVWSPSIILNRSLLSTEISTLHETAPRLSVLPTRKPRLHLSTIYHSDHEHEEIYRDHNISFDNLRINYLWPNSLWQPQAEGDIVPPRVSWTERLDEMIAIDRLLGARRVIFDNCCQGVPGIVEWVQEQARKGWIIEEVAFVNCDGEFTQSDYTILKDSGVVENVVWTS
jgi:hypothetical protein